MTDHEKKITTVTVRMPVWMKEYLTKTGAEQERKLSQEVFFRLKKSIEIDKGKK